MSVRILIVMIWCVRLLQLGFIVVFSVGVTCSMICPERLIVPAKNHQHDGPCTDCTSTDFIGGAKVSVENVSLNVTAGLDLDSFVAPLSMIGFLEFASTSVLVEPTVPLCVTNRILRL